MRKTADDLACLYLPRWLAGLGKRIDARVKTLALTDAAALEAALTEFA